MTFGEFWRLYLRAHSLPGTRALHYFATVIGTMSVIQAVTARQPLLLIGIGLGYAIAIGAHWFIERNQPLIRVNALWGAAADLRMFWLALTGRLGGEIADGTAQRFLSSQDVSGPRSRSPRAVPAAGPAPRKMTGYVRLVLLAVSAIGLTAALADLDDLFEVDAGLRYALVQLGMPIAAFAGAFIAGVSAIAMPHPANLVPTGARRSRWRAIGDATTIAASRLATSEVSLWRACAALLVFGAFATVMTELAEQGLSGSTQLYMVFGAVTVLSAAAPVFPRHSPKPR